MKKKELEKKKEIIQDSFNENIQNKSKNKAVEMKNENINLIEYITQTIKDKEGKINIAIKKDLLNEVKNFLACVGSRCAGKSTFCSYCYQRRYNLNKDIFKPSDSSDSDTKGIWLLSPQIKYKIEILKIIENYLKKLKKKIFQGN